MAKLPTPTPQPVTLPISYTRKISLETQTPNDPRFASQGWMNGQWAADIQVRSVWPDYTGAGVNVGVYDDGLQYTHPDLDGKYDPSREMRWNGQRIDPLPSGSEHGHGTLVANVIAAGSNGQGAVGVAYGADVTGVPIFGPLARGGSYLVDAVRHSATFDVVNHSWWQYQAFDTAWNGADATALRAALDDVAEGGRGGLGTVVVVAAGNNRQAKDDNGHITGDANVNGQIIGDRHSVTVGAVDSTGAVTDFSSPGANLLVMAPGADVVTNGYSERPGHVGGDFGFWGTSASAPIVTGVVALMLEANPDLGWRDVKEILAASARDTGRFSGSENGASDWNGGGHLFSVHSGFGLVDAHAAVRLAETWTEQKTSHNEMYYYWHTVFGTPLPLLDWATQTDFTFDIPWGFDIETVVLDLGLDHDSVGDLRIMLTSPSGHTISVFNGGATKSDGSAGPGIDGPWGFTISGFLGESSVGRWKVSIRDEVGNDLTGSVDWAKINFYGSAPTEDDTYIYTDDFGGSLAWDQARSVLGDTRGNDTINAAATRYHALIDLTGQQTSMVAGRELQIQAGAIENAFGGDGDDTLVGTGAGNRLVGGRGDDKLIGGGALSHANRDVLDGGEGNDTFTINAPDGASDVLGGSGVDTIVFATGLGVEADLGTGKAYLWKTTSWLDDQTGVTTEITIGSGQLAISGVENLTGTGYADTLRGDAGANRLVGGGGADKLAGGGGNDTYVLTDTSDSIVELAAGGTDTVELRAGLSYRLGDHLENLTLLEPTSGIPTLPGVTVPTKPGAYPVANSATGNELGNTLIGNTQGNLLDGGAGRDTLSGGAGNDVLVGGLGADRLAGGAGADVFVFRFADESTVAGVDTIHDFMGAPKGGVPKPGLFPPTTPTQLYDIVDLSGIDARTTLPGDDAFVFIGTRGFSGAGQLRFEYLDGGKDGPITLVQGEVTGDGVADFQVALLGQHALHAGSFVL